MNSITDYTAPEYNKFAPNLPSFGRRPVNGQVGQARDRAAAPRGGTPNATEIPNDPVPAAGGAITQVSGVPQAGRFGNPYPTGYVPVAANADRGPGDAQPTTALAARPQPTIATSPEETNSTFSGAQPGESTGGVFDWLQRKVQAASAARLAGDIPREWGTPGGANAAAATVQPQPAQAIAAPVVTAGVPPGGAGSGGAAVPRDLAAERQQAIAAAAPAAGADIDPAGPPGSDYNPSPYKQQYDQMRQNEATDLAGKNHAMSADADRADAYLDKQKAEGEARVANFRATNGADMVLAPENRGYDDQRQAIVDDARAKTARAAAAGGTLRDANVTLAHAADRNPILEAQVQGETANRAGLTNASITDANTRRPLLVDETKARTAGTKINNELGGLQVGAAKRDANALAAIDAAATPAEREQRLGTYLRSRGHEKYVREDVEGEPDATGQRKVLQTNRSTIDGMTPAERRKGEQPTQATKLPAGVSAEQARANAKKMVSAGKMTQAQADAEMKSYGL